MNTVVSRSQKLALIATLAAGATALVVSLSSAFADGTGVVPAPVASPTPRGTMIQVLPIEAAGGVQVGYGICPCFRVTTRIQGLGGKIETRDFLISSDSLFRVDQSQNFQLAQVMSRTYTIGAVEALWKGGHIGLSFDGVSIGDDIDRGYSEMVKTGVYALINIVRNESLRLDIRSGYEFDRMRVNLSDPVERHILEQELRFRWQSGAWSGNISARVGMNALDPLNYGQYRASGDIGIHARVLTLGDLQLGLGLNISAEHDPFREAYGLAANGITGGLSMDISWVPKFMQRDGSSEN